MTAVLQDPLKPGTFQSISAYFGAIVGSGPYKGTAHNGIDLPANLGTPVYAATPGVVTRVDSKDPGGGLIVEVYNRATGIKTQYAHLSAANVKVGQTVQQGQQVAAVGHSGSATGNHLHFGVAQCSVGSAAPASCSWQNPLSYLDLFGKQGAYATLANAPSVDPKAIQSWYSDWLGKNPDRQSETVRQFLTTPPSFSGWSWGYGPDVLNKLPSSLLDKPFAQLTPSDWQLLSATIAGNTQGAGPLFGAAQALLGWTDALAKVLGFLLDPVNWLRIFAMIAGGALVLIGGRWVYQAT